ncbi:hypothetical protein RJ640_005238 [Escallonia rubra]|uniref:Disease resistance protein RGA3 n=1 Tax=Escallonia rubra TaxID=112253 RepID=A0AA88QQV9_9ASTE|nr:hypothetical protein RJ640_005238 [Escallonia rubra]
MAETLLSVVAEGILSKVLSLAADEVSLAWGFKAELKRLAKRLKTVQDLLSDAESKQFTMNTVETWLRSLTAVAYDADTVLDEFAYEVLRQKVEVQDRIKHKVRDFFSPSKNPLAFRLKVAHKIKNINLSLDEIFRVANQIGLRPVEMINCAVQRFEVQITHPGVGDLEKVVGRDADVSNVVGMLLNSTKSLSVITIVGMPGQGKTTLAKLIYHNEKVVGHFDKKIWVSVSDDFDCNRILSEMVQSVTQTNPQLSNIEGILKLLQEHLNGKKYLLILDDVWNDVPETWECMRDALLEIGGSKGSRILVTTRSDAVATTMASLTYPLERLTDEDGWTIFKQRAFADGGATETDELVDIGKKIVKRCGGLPLATKALGSVMQSKKSIDQWLSIQNNSHLWDLPENGVSIVRRILKLSYDHLPSSSLKHCFAYCSLHPKDFNIQKDSLVQLWMALGLLHPPKGSGFFMEDVGNNYFNALLLNSLLQEVAKDKIAKYYREAEAFKTLPLFVVSRERECKIEDLGGLKNLRGKLHIDGLEDVGNMDEAKKANLSTKADIHALEFHWRKKNHNKDVLEEEDSGESVLEGLNPHSNLKGLKIENFPGKTFSSWMMVVSQSSLVLQNLVEMILMYCHRCERIPTLGHLPCLKVIRIHGMDGIKRIGTDFYGHNANGGSIAPAVRMFPALKQLSLSGLENVQEWFEVGNDTPSTVVFPYLEELNLQTCPKLATVPSHFPYLKRLSIFNLDHSFALQNMSRNLTCLTYLYLSSVDGSELQFVVEELLGNNKASLRELTIVRCDGLSYLPIQKLGALKSLRVEECKNLTHIQDFLGSLASLRMFSVRGCEKLISLPKGLEALSSLETLRIGGFQTLSGFPWTLNLLTSLRMLEISGFRNLTSLPQGLETLTSIESLVIRECHHLKDIYSLVFLRNVKGLTLHRCPDLVFPLPDLRCLAKLRKLGIGGFSEDLDTFPWPSFNYSLLANLNLKGWPKLKSLPEQLQHLSSLKRLSLVEFHGLEALPDWLGNLFSLGNLILKHCKSLKDLPSSEAMQRLTKLEMLEIEFCPILQERCRKEIGPEWCKIEHIPNIYFGRRRVE